MSVRLSTYILVIFFGSSSWLSTNSVWMQLPLLTDELPERWNLPSYLAAIVQLACIGPLVYSILHKWHNITIPIGPVIMSLLIFCCICTALLAFFWSFTAVIFNEERSVVLMILMFGLALVNTTSSVLFMPYMSIFHPSYLTAYFVGLSFSALFPSVVSMVQGAGDECRFINDTLVRVKIAPLFSIREFNLIMLLWLIVASISFALLNWTSLGVENDNSISQTAISPSLPADESVPLSPYGSLCVTSRKKFNSKRLRYLSFLFIMAFINGQMNGVIPSIQSFAALPYSQATYRFALTFSNIASPLSCFLPLFFATKSLGLITLLTLIASCFTAYIVVLAAMSPAPILQFSLWGKVLSILAAICSSSILSYLRTLLTSVIREEGDDGESRLFWCGVAIQVGSFIASCIMFPLVNVFNFFKSTALCTD